MSHVNEQSNPNGATPVYSVGIPNGRRIQFTHDFLDGTPVAAASASTTAKNYVQYIQISNTTAAPVTVTISDGATVIWKVVLNNVITQSSCVDLAGSLNTALNVTAVAGVTVNLQGSTY